MNCPRPVLSAILRYSEAEAWVLFGRPPDPKVMEVYNDFNSNLTNLYACVKNHTMEFLRQLGFLPLNGR